MEEEDYHLPNCVVTLNGGLLIKQTVGSLEEATSTFTPRVDLR